jgi:hypothetical protein
MARSSDRQHVNDARTVVGYGDTKDLAFNDLLEKLKAHESEIRCARSGEGEACRPFLSPPTGVIFPHLLAKEHRQDSLALLWGPGVLEFECACAPETEN